MTLGGVYLTKAWSAVVVLTFALVNHLDQRQSVGQSLALALPRDSEDKTSQELRMLSRSLSDCKSLLLNVMIQVS